MRQRTINLDTGVASDMLRLTTNQTTLADDRHRVELALEGDGLDPRAAELIDQIVYALYALTEAEIVIVEESVSP